MIMYPIIIIVDKVITPNMAFKSKLSFPLTRPTSKAATKAIGAIEIKIITA